MGMCIFLWYEWCAWGVECVIVVRWIGGDGAPPYREETRTCIRKQSKKTNGTTDGTAAEHVVISGDKCERAATRRV